MRDHNYNQIINIKYNTGMKISKNIKSKEGQAIQIKFYHISKTVMKDKNTDYRTQLSQ